MVRLIACAALVAATLPLSPALAQSRDEERDDSAQALRQLQDPRVSASLATLVEGLAQSLMAMPVGPLAESVRRIDPDSELADMPRDATLGEMAHVDARDARALGDQAHAAGTMLAGMARSLEVMMPTLRAMARDMNAQMEQQWDSARREARNR